MLKCEVKDGGRNEIAAAGSLEDICSDILFVIKNIYDNAVGSDKELSEEFKNMIVSGVTDPRSPLWKEVKND